MDGGGDAFGQSTAALTFHDFLDRMRQPAAADLVLSIKSFIVAFLSSTPHPEKDSLSVQEFLTSTEAVLRTHPLWSGACQEELDSAGEGLEKYLMTKLFQRAFAPTGEDLDNDRQLSERMAVLQNFIKPEHLDIPPNFYNEAAWLLAQKELQKINIYKAPRDKLVCILNCCRVINNLLLNMSMGSDGNPPGADDFLPVLIFIVIKANPPQLQSNLLYIQRYRHHSRMVSEASYFYTNLVSAVSFVMNLSPTSLSMDPGEYARLMQGVADTPFSQETQASPLPPAPAPPTPTWVAPEASDKVGQRTASPLGPVSPSISEPDFISLESSLQGRRASSKKDMQSSVDMDTASAMALLQADSSGQIARDYPLLFAVAGDLRVGDVTLLLNDYKELVLKYEQLCHKFKLLQAGGARSTPPLAGPAKAWSPLTEADSQQAMRSPPLEATFEGLQMMPPLQAGDGRELAVELAHSNLADGLPPTQTGIADAASEALQAGPAAEPSERASLTPLIPSIEGDSLAVEEELGTSAPAHKSSATSFFDSVTASQAPTSDEEAACQVMTVHLLLEVELGDERKRTSLKQTSDGKQRDGFDKTGALKAAMWMNLSPEVLEKRFAKV
eukprot:SM000012S25288  [mRNA]  locus=s12:93969:98406:- [translate_table: standard]